MTPESALWLVVVGGYLAGVPINADRYGIGICYLWPLLVLIEAGCFLSSRFASKEFDGRDSYEEDTGERHE